MAALEEAFRAYHPRLCAFVRHQVRSPETAEELVQDVFLRLWQHRARLHPEGSVRAFLYQAAHNAALNHLKRRSIERRWLRRAQVEPPRPGNAADEPVREHELAAAVAHAIAALPERCRLVFVLSRQQGLSYAEIAEALDVSIKTVETQMGRALKALRRRLSAYWG